MFVGYGGGSGRIPSLSRNSHKGSMLVLTRKPGQSLYIGEDIKVTLQGIRGNQIRLGIEAPSSVRIYREEIYQQILEENQSAAVAVAETGADLGSIAMAWKDKKTEALSSLSRLQTSPMGDEEEDNGAS